MALTELQSTTKANFYSKLQRAANQMDNVIIQWENLSEMVNRMDDTDLDTMEIPAGQIRTDLIEFRIVLEEMVSLYNGNQVTPTNNPENVINKIRSL